MTRYNEYIKIVNFFGNYTKISTLLVIFLHENIFYNLPDILVAESFDKNRKIYTAEFLEMTIIWECHKKVNLCTNLICNTSSL